MSSSEVVDEAHSSFGVDGNQSSSSSTNTNNTPPSLNNHQPNQNHHHQQQQQQFTDGAVASVIGKTTTLTTNNNNFSSSDADNLNISNHRSHETADKKLSLIHNNKKIMSNGCNVNKKTNSSFKIHQNDDKDDEDANETDDDDENEASTSNNFNSNEKGEVIVVKQTISTNDESERTTQEGEYDDLHKKALAHYYAKLNRRDEEDDDDDWRQDSSSSSPPIRERSVSDVINVQQLQQQQQTKNDNTVNYNNSNNHNNSEVETDNNSKRTVGSQQHYQKVSSSYDQRRSASPMVAAAAAATAATITNYPVSGASPFFANPFVAPFSAHLPQAQIVNDDGSINSSLGIFNGVDSNNVRMNPYSGGFYISPQYYQELFQQYMRAVNAAGHNVGVSPASEQGDVIYDDTNYETTPSSTAEIQRIRSSTDPTDVGHTVGVQQQPIDRRLSSSVDHSSTFRSSEQSAFEEVQQSRRPTTINEAQQKIILNQQSANSADAGNNDSSIGKRLAEQMEANIFAQELAKKVNNHHT